jgi:hypothetical protein
MYEHLNENYGFFCASSKIETSRTEFGTEIHETPQFGKLFGWMAVSCPEREVRLSRP